MRFLIAPNAFKNSISAKEAAEAIYQGLLQSGLPCKIVCFPIGDGGDGTGSLIVENKNGYFFNTTATDPIGRKIITTIGFIDGGKTAVIEMASISGLKLLKAEEMDPMSSTTYGCGELIRTALDRGARKIILCIGGTATVDGGVGILRALGIRFLDHNGHELGVFPAGGELLASIDISNLDKRIRDTELILLCDVENYLLGVNGAAAIFGPQKGASPENVRNLESALKKFADIAYRLTGTDMKTQRYGGAAGGSAAGLSTFLSARLVKGIDYFLDLTGFDQALKDADILITGEGKMDNQTLEGKGPSGVAIRAKKKNIPVIGLAGEIPLRDYVPLKLYFDILLTIGRRPEEKQMAISHTSENLKYLASQIGKIISIGQKQIN